MRRSFLSYLALAGSFILAGCAPKPSAPQPSSAGSRETVIWSQNGWSDAERAEYYHLAEGSELIPYALLSNLASVKTGKPFVENMQRFGFILDAAGDRKSTRLNSSHLGISYAVF